MIKVHVLWEFLLVGWAAGWFKNSLQSYFGLDIELLWSLLHVFQSVWVWKSKQGRDQRPGQKLSFKVLYDHDVKQPFVQHGHVKITMIQRSKVSWVPAGG